MSRLHTGSALAAGALLLAACGGDVVMRTGPPLPGTNALFSYAAAGGAMPTLILGNPFPLPKSEVDAAVVDAMAGSYAGPDARFVATQTPPPNVIVVLLNGSRAMDARLLCSNRARATPVPQDDLSTVVIGFCSGDTLMSGVTGRVPMVSSPRDPAYRGMIARAMVDMIPTMEQEESDLRR